MSTSLILLILVIAAVVLFYTKKEIELKKDSINWLSTESTVSSSRVRRTFDKKSGTSDTNFLFELQYNYEVDGQSYVGKRYQFYGLPTFKIKDEAEKLVAEYPTGKKIVVYYQPENPQEAVIIR